MRSGEPVPEEIVGRGMRRRRRAARQRHRRLVDEDTIVSGVRRTFKERARDGRREKVSRMLSAICWFAFYQANGSGPKRDARHMCPRVRAAEERRYIDLRAFRRRPTIDRFVPLIMPLFDVRLRTSVQPRQRTENEGSEAPRLLKLPSICSIENAPREKRK